MTIQGKPARQLYEGAVDTWTQLALRCFVFYLFWLLIDPKKKKKRRGGGLEFMYKATVDWNFKKKKERKETGRKSRRGDWGRKVTDRCCSLEVIQCEGADA